MTPAVIEQFTARCDPPHFEHTCLLLHRAPNLQLPLFQNLHAFGTGLPPPALAPAFALAPNPPEDAGAPNAAPNPPDVPPPPPNGDALAPPPPNGEGGWDDPNPPNPPNAMARARVCARRARAIARWARRPNVRASGGDTRWARRRANAGERGGSDLCVPVVTLDERHRRTIRVRALTWRGAASDRARARLRGARTRARGSSSAAPIDG